MEDTRLHAAWLSGIILVLGSLCVELEALEHEQLHRFKYVRVPRFTMEEFASASEDVRTGNLPFVLSGIGAKWKGLHEFPVEDLATNYSDAIVEFYPYNLIEIGNKPFLVSFRRALNEVRENDKPKYLQVSTLHHVFLVRDPKYDAMEIHSTFSY